MCEHLSLRVKEEQLLQTAEALRNGRSGDMSGSRVLGAATGKQPIQEVATQLDTHIIPDLLGL